MSSSRRLSFPRERSSAVGLRLRAYDNVVCSTTDAGHLPVNDRYRNVAAGAAWSKTGTLSAIGFALPWLTQDRQHLVLRHAHVNVADVQLPAPLFSPTQPASNRSANQSRALRNLSMGLTHLKPRIFPPALDRFFAYLPSAMATTVPQHSAPSARGIPAVDALARRPWGRA